MKKIILALLLLSGVANAQPILPPLGKNGGGAAYNDPRIPSGNAGAANGAVIFDALGNLTLGGTTTFTGLVNAYSGVQASSASGVVGSGFQALDTDHAILSSNIVSSPSYLGNALGGVFTVSLNNTPSGNLANAYYIGSVYSAQGNASSGGTHTTLTATAIAGATTVTVTSIAGASNGDPIFVKLSDGSIFRTNVVGTPSGSNVTMQDAVPPIGIANGTAIYFPKAHFQGSIGAAILNASSKDVFGAEGVEFNTSMRSGSSVMFKCIVCAANNSDDAVQGLMYDMVYGASSETGGVQNQNGFLFGPWSGQHPVSATGTLIKSIGATTVGSFLDFSSYSCTNKEINFQGFSVDCAGNMSAKTASLAAGILGTVINSSLVNQTVASTAGTNITALSVVDTRAAAGSDWTTAEKALRYSVDSSVMASLVFNPYSFPSGVSLRYGGVDYLALDSHGNVVVGGAVAPSSTSGFLMVTSMAGMPTGVPALTYGRTPMTVDTTDSKVCFLIGASWKCANLL